VDSESDLQLQLKSDKSSFSTHVLLSHPFDATMQRMTVFAMITRDLSNTPDISGTTVLGGGVEGGAVTGWTGGQTPDTEYLIASKGSPESIFECLSAPQREDSGFRDSYFRVFKELASQGKRVIAFASRSVSCSPLDCSKNNKRADAERNLSFQGFVSFECPLR
jgi:magnesium-transporting ATPase (P-type)